MLVLAIDAAWVGVVGVAVGGLLGFATSWVVHRSERADRIAERSRADRKEARAEKKEAYAALLTHAEDSMHLFEWLAKGRFSPAGPVADRASADTFYDHEVTPRGRVLEILVDNAEIAKAADDMRMALNGVRHLMVDSEIPPTADNSEFRARHRGYRKARNRFIDLARADLRLDEGPGPRPNTETP
jgi:hypothetical protein